MSKPVIVLDFDGCIASQGKIWQEEFSKSKPMRKRLTVSKAVSDHDSWVIDKIKDDVDILILSGDERINKAWAERRGVEFLFTATAGFHADKWKFLVEWFHQKYGHVPEYFYLGDAPPDLKCMQGATKAFIPADACFHMIRQASENDFVTLTRNSGCGCVEEMVSMLVYNFQLLPEEILR